MPCTYLSLFSNFLHTVNIIVTKQAVPPTKLDMGSARNTPFVPRLAIVGSHKVSGITIIAFRNKEKKTAWRYLPNAVKVDWPANCKAIIKIPKKYKCMAGTPFSKSSGSLLNRWIKKRGKKNSSAHAAREKRIQNKVVNLMEDFTRSYFLAP